MNKLVKSLLVVGASLVAANSAVASMIDDFCPYVGIDYKQRWVHERYDGTRDRSASLYGGSIYIGSRWDCFGLEAGLDASGRRNRRVTIGGVDRDVRINMWGGYLDALAYVPVAECVDIFGGFGVGVLTARTSFSPDVTGPFIVGRNNRARAVARLRLGANYLFTDCVGIRGVLGWETTENLVTRVGHIFGNSFTAQAGVFVKF